MIHYDFAFDNNKFNIVWVGRITEQKGVNDLILIISKINKTKYGARVYWNIIGDGPERGAIERLADKHNNVNYFGQIKNEYMPSILKKNSLFISTSKWEGFPYNLLEAQSVGMPVLAYNIAGCNEIIKNNINGILVRDSNEFVAAIKEFVDKKHNFANIDQYIRLKFDSKDIFNHLFNSFFKHVEK